MDKEDGQGRTESLLWEEDSSCEGGGGGGGGGDEPLGRGRLNLLVSRSLGSLER